MMDGDFLNINKYITHIYKLLISSSDAKCEVQTVSRPCWAAPRGRQASGCGGFRRRAQAARWEAKNSPFRRDPGSQRAQLLQALPGKPTRCFFFCGMRCRDNAERLRQREGWGGRGEAAPAPRFLELATTRVSSPEGFFQGEKRRLGPAPWCLCVSNVEQFVQPLSFLGPCLA